MKESLTSKRMTDRELLRSCMEAMHIAHRVQGARTDWSIMIEDIRRHLESSAHETPAGPTYKVWRGELCDLDPGEVLPDGWCAVRVVERLTVEPRETSPLHAELQRVYGLVNYWHDEAMRLRTALSAISTNTLKSSTNKHPQYTSGVAHGLGIAADMARTALTQDSSQPARQSPQGSVPTVGAPTAPAAPGSPEEPSPCMGMWHVPVITCAKCGTALKQCSECRVISGHRYDCSTQKAPGRASLACVHRDGCRKFPACMVEARCCGNDASIPETR